MKVMTHKKFPLSSGKETMYSTIRFHSFTFITLYFRLGSTITNSTEAIHLCSSLLREENS